MKLHHIPFIVGLSCFLIGCFAWEALPAADLQAEEPLQYNRDIRPILSGRCFACHGPDEESREADLRLDDREEAIDFGAIAPGSPDDSLLLERIVSTDPDLVMPPPHADMPLSATEQATLRRWIETGAEYQQHWAFEPIQRFPIPEVADPGWCRTPVDRFILQALEKRKIAPSPAANRITLIRRLYLDLIGLLPTADQVDAFVNDQSPDAYDRLVDELLESPHFGERWGRHWLDQARYADSNGYTFDTERQMWPYRDWVIDALNRDMPFDQFTIEQLAGDLLPDATISQRIATGFHRNTLINQEGGTDDEQFRVESVIDRTNTTGTVWLGMTVGCAQCHTHKFDPITQEDYFALYAYFNSTVDKNNVGPQVLLKSAASEQLNELKAKLTALKTEQEKSRLEQTPAESVSWTQLNFASFQSESDAKADALDDGSLLVSGTNATFDDYIVEYEISPQSIAALQLDVLPHPSLPLGGPGRASNGNFVLGEVELYDAAGKRIPLHPTAIADYSQPGHDISRTVDGNVKTGWAINTNSKGNVAHWAQFILSEPLVASEATRLRLTLRFWQGTRPYNLGRFQLSASPIAPPVPDAALQASIDTITKQIKTLEGRRVRSMVMQELPEPRESHLFVRGDFLRPGDPVVPHPPSVLPAQFPSNPVQGTDDSKESNLKQPSSDAALKDRLDLANWIVDPANPLPARVTINRIWGRYFGRGIVETTEDFGSQGTPPTHPELLDWLAVQWIESGWSLKALHRQIVTSAVYMQSSNSRPDLAAAGDPQNKWLGRQNRIRVDAEIVRDLALSASGQITRPIGGPSVYPPQPEGVYAFTQKKKNWKTSVGTDRFRRTMYTFFYRSSPHPLLTAFDTPRFNVTCTRRGRSNTPLQSLMVANDAGIFELAQHLATVVCEASDDPDQRITDLFRRCLSRFPSQEERDFLAGFAESQEAIFAEQFASESDSADSTSKNANHQESSLKPNRAAWIATARLIINLDEFITRE
ncbi:Planctomycete cytochrome C [Roseimaritima multifibrata]|uniref:Planctomycete cytochrome C n=1 Tax=Roseimaritima multifibrata TaxID=1930274 RepID=A0A517MM44_9BACT|nr:PSD1 and planctomycete cytochrome C domain-containing protein [Roseimaritima multifibrata]QDS95962.1 Planctomycete cytochrome C [Roseimaritima multifibrata]